MNPQIEREFPSNTHVHVRAHIYTEKYTFLSSDSWLIEVHPRLMATILKPESDIKKEYITKTIHILYLLIIIIYSEKCVFSTRFCQNMVFSFYFSHVSPDYPKFFSCVSTRNVLIFLLNLSGKSRLI